MFDRITQQPEVMGGKPCIRGTRVTVDMVVGLLRDSQHSEAEVLRLYPYLEAEDLRQALAFADENPEGGGGETGGGFGCMAGTIEELGHIVEPIGTDDWEVLTEESGR